MNSKRIIQLLLFLLLGLGAMAQDGEKQRFADRLFVGGGGGLQFGNITVVQVSPLVGYRITDQWHAGVGITYMYFRDNIFKYETSIYGGNVFSRYYFIEELFAHVEYDMLSLETINPVDGSFDRVWAPGMLVGGGYQQPLGARSGFFILVLMDLIQDPAYPYNNPIFRAGFAVGL